LLTIAELDEFETCHSKTPPTTEGVNAADKAAKSMVVTGQLAICGVVTEGAVGICPTVKVTGVRALLTQFVVVLRASA
jgi:hypothetical protein